ncbi:MAG: hypothetical protein V4765_02375, partial [Burkholderia cenocepacia]
RGARCGAKATGIAPHGVLRTAPPSFDGALHRGQQGCGCLSSSASLPDIERAIETHAATAHQSAGRHDIVCALCGVCFVIRNEPTGLNQTKQQ